MQIKCYCSWATVLSKMKFMVTEERKKSKRLLVERKKKPHKHIKIFFNSTEINKYN